MGVDPATGLVKEIFWPWYTLSGTIVTLGVASLVYFVFRLGQSETEKPNSTASSLTHVADDKQIHS
jgi:hypothetical protein